MTCTTMQRVVTPWDLQVDTWWSALNPDGAGGYPANGSSVSSLTDLGTKGNNLSQASGALQPTFTRSANGNFPAISFSGTQWMSCAASANNSYAGGKSSYGVWQCNASGTQRIVMKVLSWAYSAASTNYNWNIWNSGSGVAATVTGNPISSGVYQSCTMIWNAGTDVTFYKNAASYQTITPFTTLADVGVNDLYLGTRDGTQQYMVGAITDWFVFFRVQSAWEISYMNFFERFRGA